MTSTSRFAGPSIDLGDDGVVSILRFFLDDEGGFLLVKDEAFRLFLGGDSASGDVKSSCAILLMPSSSLE